MSWMTLSFIHLLRLATRTTKSLVFLAQKPMFSSRKTAQKRKPRPGHNIQAAICVVLCVLLVFGHISPFIVCSGHYEHRFVVAFGSPTEKWLPTVVTALSQLIGTVRYTSVFICFPRLYPKP